MYHLVASIILTALMACNQNTRTTALAADTIAVNKVDTTSVLLPAQQAISADSAVAQLNRTLLTLLKNKNYAALIPYMHPTRGTWFSPYGFVDTLQHQRLSRQDFEKVLSTNLRLYWGYYDGSGDSILLTSRQYFEKFVYNKDFLHAEKTSLNKTLGKGNSVNNLEAVYTGSLYVENYFSGFDKKYAGMDWCSLRLVFEKVGDNYYLVGLVHDQWTS